MFLAILLQIYYLLLPPLPVKSIGHINCYKNASDLLSFEFHSGTKFNEPLTLPINNTLQEAMKQFHEKNPNFTIALTDGERIIRDNQNATCYFLEFTHVKCNGKIINLNKELSKVLECDEKTARLVLQNKISAQNNNPMKKVVAIKQKTKLFLQPSQVEDWTNVELIEENFETLQQEIPSLYEYLTKEQGNYKLNKKELELANHALICSQIVKLWRRKNETKTVLVSGVFTQDCHFENVEFMRERYSYDLEKLSVLLENSFLEWRNNEEIELFMKKLDLHYQDRYFWFEDCEKIQFCGSIKLKYTTFEDFYSSSRDHLNWPSARLMDMFQKFKVAKQNPSYLASQNSMYTTTNFLIKTGKILHVKQSLKEGKYYAVWEDDLRVYHEDLVFVIQFILDFKLHGHGYYYHCYTSFFGFQCSYKIRNV